MCTSGLTSFLFQIIVRIEYRCPDIYQRNTLVFTFLRFRTGFYVLQIGKISFSYPNALFTQSEFIRTVSKNPNCIVSGRIVDTYLYSKYKLDIYNLQNRMKVLITQEGLIYAEEDMRKNKLTYDEVDTRRKGTKDYTNEKDTEMVTVKEDEQSRFRKSVENINWSAMNLCRICACMPWR